MEDLPVHVSQFFKDDSNLKHQFIWKIENYNGVVSTPESIVRSTVDFVVQSKSGEKYKFRIGFKIVEENRFGMYLRLLRMPAIHQIIYVKWTVECSRTGERDTWNTHPDRTISVPTPIEMNQELTVGRDTWILGTNFDNDADGYAWWKITLIIECPANNYMCSEYEAATDKLKATSLGQLQQQLAMLSNDADSADLKINCSDGITLTAHGIILAARNPVFASMLTSGMTESNTGVMTVDDISSPVMKIVLHFLYTGDLAENWQLPENILEFTYAAGKYQLMGVLEMLDAVLGTKEIATCNMQLLSMANKLSLKNAEQRLMKSLISMATDIDTSDQFISIFTM